MVKTNRNDNILIFAGGLGGSLLLILSGVVIGAVFGYAGANKGLILPDSKQQIIAAFDQKLNSKAEMGLVPFSPDSQKQNLALTSLQGELAGTNKAKSTIEVKVENRYRGGSLFSYLDEPDFYTKSVKIDSNTKITKREQKDAQVLQKEMESYVKKSNDPKNVNVELTEPPQPYTEKVISINDMSIGSRVYVVSEKEFNLNDNSEIKAKRIEVQ